jgi:hypothetical protein
MTSPPAESQSPLRNDLLALIARHLRSATEIELLLLLHRSPETFWTPAAAASVVNAGEQETRAHFGRFAAAGLIERGRESDAFRFAPSSDERRETVQALAAAYVERRADVLGAALGSLSQITAFSDAFGFYR